jgi:GNAT superfamily N-acetyltransferase
VTGHVSLSIAGNEFAEDLERLWVRASARRHRQPIPESPEPEQVAALARRVGRPGAAAVIAEDDGVAVGCCFFELLTEPDRQTIIDGAAHLSGVAVEPSRWGEGIATALLTFAERRSGAVVSGSYGSTCLRGTNGREPCTNTLGGVWWPPATPTLQGRKRCTTRGSPNSGYMPLCPRHREGGRCAATPLLIATHENRR